MKVSLLCETGTALLTSAISAATPTRSSAESMRHQNKSHQLIQQHVALCREPHLTAAHAYMLLHRQSAPPSRMPFSQQTGSAAIDHTPECMLTFPSTASLSKLKRSAIASIRSGRNVPSVSMMATCNNQHNMHGYFRDGKRHSVISFMMQTGRGLSRQHSQLETITSDEVDEKDLSSSSSSLT